MQQKKQQEISQNSKQFQPRWYIGMLTKKTIGEFRQHIWTYYQESGRSFPWRQTQDPYHIVVSEIMLQQTQTYRVEEKYKELIRSLPDFYSLAHASQKEVLQLWQGLGYNSRAIRLQQTAKKIIEEFNGELPNDPIVLKEFPGIGPATAASICAFAFNRPTVFIETNIRAVFIHLFFPRRNDVHDNEIMPLVAKTLPKKEARHWYYALMDYGVMLKKTLPNPARNSSHYTRQSKFEGSARQIRGMVLKLLIEFNKLSQDELLKLLSERLGCAAERAAKIIDNLVDEDLIKRNQIFYYI